MTKARTHTPELGQASRARHHYQASVDIHLLLMRDGQVLLGRRSNTGYGDGAYEPPSSRLDERETVVEAAIRVAAAQAGIALTASHVTLAHVMHDVSGAGRIAFFLTADGWDGEPGGACASYSDLAWFAADELPANMIDRARVAVRNYAAGIGFSTYPAFLSGGIRTNPPAGSLPLACLPPYPLPVNSQRATGQDPRVAERDLRGAGPARVLRVGC